MMKKDEEATSGIGLMRRELRSIRTNMTTKPHGPRQFASKSRA
jgi:hypothetical protein